MSAEVEVLAEHDVDLVLDAPEVDVEPDLEIEPPVPIDALMLPGETILQCVRRLLDEAKRERLIAKYGPGWNRKLALVEEKLPRKQ